jgi:hypothetical protein
MITLFCLQGDFCAIAFMHLGYLSKSDYENWRFRRVSPLERVLTVNLSRINFIEVVEEFGCSAWSAV